MAALLSLALGGLVAPPVASAAGIEGAAVGWGVVSTLGTNGTVVDDSVAVPAVAGIQAGGDDTYVDISAGDTSACALDAAGQAYCWGRNGDGQVGNGTTGATVLAATPVSNGANAGGTYADVDAGGKHACGVTSAGGAYCWGQNGQGRLGDGTTIGRTTPVAVLAGQNPSGGWRQVSAGSWFTCGIGGDDSAYCWGAGGAGNLGNGDVVNASTPVRVLGGPYRTVSAGVGHACAVTADMQVDCWGSNSSGQLGDGTITSSSVPVRVSLPSGDGAWDVQVGEAFTCARMTSNRIMCWGDNTYGQLGLGHDGGIQPIPAYVGWNSWRYLSVGSLTACAVDFEWAAYCWGHNNAGQVGDGTQADRSSPTAVVTSGVLNGKRVSAISTGLRIDSGYTSTGTLTLARSSSASARLQSAGFIDAGEAVPGNATTGSMTFTNDGDTALQAASPLFRIVGPQAGVFAITADTCSGQIIAPSATCSVSVTATPPAPGPVIARMLPDPATPLSGDIVHLAARGARTAPVYPTRTWWVAQSGTANLSAGTSCAAPDAVGTDDTAIRTVLSVVSADDTVHICPGTYAITSTLAIDDSITVQGESPAQTVLDGGGAVQVMRLLDYGVNSTAITDPVVTVQNLTIQDGAAGLAGSSYDDPCALYPRCGGAIYAEDGTSLTVVDSVFTDNQAAFMGGAVSTDGNEDYTGGLVTIRSSTFVGNIAGVDAGAFGVAFNFKGGGLGHPVSDSTFVDNRALQRSGGAIAAVFADARVSGSTFLDNEATYTADALGGGVTLRGSLLASSSRTCVFDGNNEPQQGCLCDSGVDGDSTNIATDGSCDRVATPYADVAIIGLGDWGGPTPTVWIGPGSATDDANTGTCAATDQRGASRSSPCDAGAFERRSGAAQATTSALTYPSTVGVTLTANPLTTPAVAAAAPAPTYALGSGGCTVDGSTGAVTGVTTGACSIDWTIAATLTQDGAQDQASLTVVKLDQPALSVVAPASASVNTTVTLSTTGGAGTGVVTYDVGGSTVCSVVGAALSLGGSAGTCQVTATKAGDATYNSQTSSTASIAVTESSPPRPGPWPNPVLPPGPTVPDGRPPVIAGDGELVASWGAPASGVLPVVRYEVSATPGDHICVVEAPRTSCLVSGLVNGTAYLVRVRAFNAAGWGPWTTLATDAKPMGPSATASIVITGSRGEVGGRPGILISGVTTGLDAGAVLRPWMRFPGQVSYTKGAARIRVDASGGFAWERRTGKKVYVFMRTAAGDVQSNRVIITR